jgi:hypothetical protein
VENIITVLVTPAVLETPKTVHALQVIVDSVEKIITQQLPGRVAQQLPQLSQAVAQQLSPVLMQQISAVSGRVLR